MRVLSLKADCKQFQGMPDDKWNTVEASARLILEVKTVPSELLVPCNKSHLVTGNYSSQ